MVAVKAQADTVAKSGKASVNLPSSNALAARADGEKGRILQIFSKVPPIISTLNHVPESQPERLVIRAPQMPPTAFSDRMVPNRSPRLMYRQAVGSSPTATDRVCTEGFSPMHMAAIMHRMLCANAMGSIGRQ